MSSQLVRSEILRFLGSRTPEVLCVRGAWGVGKTYAWRHFLKQALATSGGVALERYAYVSLFGVNSLDELKYAIFESTLKATQSDSGPNFATLQESVRTLETIGRKGARWVTMLPWAKNFADLAKSSYFLSTRQQIICLDDLERKGTNLRLTDVLGLVSFLKEERNCKVALLLNSSELQGTDNDAFDKYLEKVVDRSLEFVPTSKECAEIAFTGGDEIAELVSASVVSLGISNIRVMRKIEYIARELHVVLRDYHPEVFRRTYGAMVLFAWAYYQPTVAPALDFLTTKKAERTFGLTETEELTLDEARWNTLLNAYGYRWTDEFDLAILAGLKVGYFDPDVISGFAKPMHEEIQSGHAQELYRQAWTLYHESFDDNEDEVVAAITKELHERVRYIPLGGINSAVRLFKDLGHPDEASALIEFYVENRDAEEKFWDLDHYAFGSDFSDPDLQAAVRAKHATYLAIAPDPAELLRSLMASDGLNSRALDPLAATSAQEFYRIFKSTQGNDLSWMLDAVFQYRRFANPTQQMTDVMDRASEALQIIGRESPINARRVSRFGIKIDKDEPPAMRATESTQSPAGYPWALDRSPISCR